MQIILTMYFLFLSLDQYSHLLCWSTLVISLSIGYFWFHFISSFVYFDNLSKMCKFKVREVKRRHCNKILKILFFFSCGLFKKTDSDAKTSGDILFGLFLWRLMSVPSRCRQPWRWLSCGFMATLRKEDVTVSLLCVALWGRRGPGAAGRLPLWAFYG